MSSIEIKKEDFIYTNKEKLIPLSDVGVFSLIIKPNKEECKILAEQGFVEYEPDYIDGMYHFARKEYLL